MSKRRTSDPWSNWATPPRERPTPAMLRSLLATRGGFTIDWRAGTAIDDGVAVCVDPAATLVFDFDDWCDQAVWGWLRRTEPNLVDGLHVGGWLDGRRRCWLDLVRVFRSELTGRAVELGRSLDQHAAFDLRRCSLIHLTDCTDRIDRTDRAASQPAPVPVPVSVGSS